MCAVCWQVPVNLRRNWAHYYVELTMMFGMLVYFVAFLLGRSKNSTLAQAWFKANKELLEYNFAIVGKYPMYPDVFPGRNSLPRSRDCQWECDFLVMVYDYVTRLCDCTG